LELNEIFTPKLLLGLEFGFFYGILILGVSQLDFVKKMSGPQERMLKSLELNWGDIVFMSFCAAFGEEVLFRAGLQTWLGPVLTTVVFIAIHGYLNPLSLQKSILGFILFPFILIISYSYEVLGLWFCIGAHFSYDLLMFQGALKSKLKS
jgi:membrane protease YdiL (CAAX protease family)